MNLHPRRGRTHPALKVEGLTKSFGGNHVLRGVSFAAESGQITGLIGPNGAGKSTLANVLSGFTQPDTGEMHLYGHPLPPGGPSLRAGLGLARTFQNLEVFTGMPVRRNVAMGAYALGRHGAFTAVLGSPAARHERREADEQAMGLLNRFGLASLADRAVENLSFGQAKMVELARALAMRPRVLVLDEPAAGLPADSVEVVGKLIRDIADQHVSVLLIEHNMKLVMGVCDTIHVLVDGSVLVSGPPRTIQSDRRVIDVYLGGAAINDEEDQES